MDEQERSGRDALACPGWRWMPGMLSSCGRRVSIVDTYPLGVREGDNRARPDYGPVAHDSWPVLTDPATVGCLEALVREAHHQHVLCMPLAGGMVWHACRERNQGKGLVIGSGGTKGQALVAALKAAGQGVS